MHHIPHSSTELLNHANWIRGLARHLIADPGGAEDAVQETLLAASTSSGPKTTRTRPWLAAILRNKVRSAQRAAARRARRERQVARPEALPSTAEVVERAQLHRQVVDVVLTLKEPFKSTVLLRYFDDLSPPEIAAQLGIPLKTVHSRLARAHVSLKEILDGEFGGRTQWRAALLPLTQIGPGGAIVAPAPGSAPGSATGSATGSAATGSASISQKSLIMTATAKWGGTALIVLALGLGYWQLEQTPRLTPNPAPRADPTPTPSAQLPQGAAPTATPQGAITRTAAAGGASPPDTAAATEPRAMTTIRGRAVDVSGRPLPFVLVQVDGSAGAADIVTTADGTFTVDVGDPRTTPPPPRTSTLRLAEPGWLGLFSARVLATSVQLEHIIVGARETKLQGRVVDSTGQPIRRASIRLSRRSEGFFDIPYPLDLTVREQLRSASDASGHFAFESFPVMRGITLDVNAPGYRRRSIALDNQPQPLLVELEVEAPASQNIVTGTVVDLAERPIAGAQVRVNTRTTRTAADGSFSLEFMSCAPSTPICAAAPGHLPGLIPNFGSLIQESNRNPDPVKLVLGAQPLSISGQLVDERGDALAGWEIFIADETRISDSQVPIITAEVLARMEHSRDGYVDPLAWSTVTTEQNGFFEIQGLFPRQYQLKAVDPGTLQGTAGTAYGGNENVVLRAKGAVCGPVHGQVVDRAGQPQQGIEVTLTREKSPGSRRYAPWEGATRITGADGRFTFDQVPREGVSLSLAGASILSTRFEFQQAPDAGLNIVEVQRRCHVRIELGAADRVDRARFLAADGTPLKVFQYTSSGSVTYPTARILNGRSEIVTVSERAATLVLLNGSEEVARHTVTVSPTSITPLRF